MNKKTWLFLIPFIVFLLGAVFLFKGLYSDPTKLESVMVGKEVPVFTLQDIYDLNKQHDRTILTGRPMLLNVWATWCPTCYGEHTYLKQLAGQGIPIIGMNYKDERDKAIKQARNDDAVGKGQLGLSLRPLDPQERRAAGLNEGLVIEQARGPAAAAGVQPGDVLLAINGAPIKDITQVRAAMAKAGKSVALLIERDGDKIFVPVRLG